MTCRILILNVLASSLLLALAAAQSPASPEVFLVRLLRLADDSQDPAVTYDILHGLRAGLQGKSVRIPPSCEQLLSRLSESSQPAVQQEALLLGIMLGRPAALQVALQLIPSGDVDLAFRAELIEASSRQHLDGLPELLFPLLENPDLVIASLRGLANYADSRTAYELISRFPTWPEPIRQEALQVLASRAAYALAVCRAIEDGEIDRDRLSQFTVRQLRLLGDALLQKRVNAIWGESRNTTGQRRRQIARLRNLLVSSVLATADLDRGRQLCEKNCLSCHRLHGSGKSIGPDLTGAQRYDLGYLLQNIVDPAADIAREFQLTVVETSDGRVISGLLIAETADALTLQTQTEQVIVSRSQVALRKKSSESLMPAGLIDQWTNQELRDLIAFLMADFAGPQ